MKTILDYHHRTKHSPQRYAASLGYMDWATQPNPFRRYPGSALISLPHHELSLPYHLLFDPDTLPKAPLCIESISHLLRYSLGLAAWKSHGGSTWALRCNASSGNLHPTECYLILPPIEGISDHAVLCHYAPKEHALELLHIYEEVPLLHGGFAIILSSVLWREAWKYGERSWRYCQLDAGHASAAIEISGRTLGWDARIESISSEEIAHLCGIDQQERYHPQELESSDLMITFNSSKKPHIPSPPLIPYQANTLSPDHHPWPVLEEIDTAARGIYPIRNGSFKRVPPKPSMGASDVILKRRSAQMMDGTSITEEAFRQILDASLGCQNAPDVNLILFVHRVQGIEPGLYAFIRDHDSLQSLKSAMDTDFVWEERGERLYLLGAGDMRSHAQFISCNQQIAKESAFSFGMLCSFSSAIEHYGGIGYKNLYHQCGAIGQILYLEATSLRLSATGIGCFLDDSFHTMLGLQDEKYQSLYHFTIGRAIVDTRLDSFKPYE